MTSYQTRAIPAIPRIASFILGTICAVVALVILVEDALKTGHWSLEHKIMPAVVLIAIVSGKLIWDAYKRHRYAAFVGFGLVCVLATALMIVISIGRQGKAADSDALAVRATNDAISRAQEELAHSRKRLTDAETMVERETTNKGCKSICRDWQRRAREVRSDIAAQEAQIKTMGPAKSTAATPENSAALLHETFGVDKVRAVRLFTLWLPVAFALLFEFGAIVSFGYACASNSTGLVPLTLSTVSAQPTPDFSAFSTEKPQETTLSADIEAPANENAESLNSEKSLRCSVSLLDVADEILEPIVIKRGGQVDSQAHLAKLSGLSEGTVSKMLTKSNKLERVWDHHSKSNVIRIKG